MLKIVNGNKFYNKGKENETHALNNADIEINEGEMVAVVGVSGSGKSTLLNILGQMDVLNSGEYYFMEENVTKLSEKKKAKFRNSYLGFIPQDNGLISKDTVLDNIVIPMYFSSKSISRAKMKAAAKKAMADMGMESYLKRKVNTLSGGQKQRVAIARALICSPKLVLADEPTGALDSATAEEIVGVFRNISEKGTAVVIVTHDMNVANKCDRIIKIHDGKIESTFAPGDGATA